MPRKPAGETWESFVDRQIREAQERGEFDDLSGAGKPIPDLHQPRDDLWWVRRKLRDEGVSYLPPALLVRREVERAREQIDRARSEREVRQLVREVNEVVRAANRHTMNGPPTRTVPLDEEAEVQRWATSRPDDGPRADHAGPDLGGRDRTRG